MAGMDAECASHSALSGDLSTHTLDRGNGRRLRLRAGHAVRVRDKKKGNSCVRDSSHHSLRHLASLQCVWRLCTLVRAGNRSVHAAFFLEHHEISPFAIVLADDTGANVRAALGIRTGAWRNLAFFDDFWACAPVFLSYS